jgi:hypothetical protein
VSPTKGAEAVEAAIDPYRAPLADGFREFTLALLGLAKSNAKHAGTFNGPSHLDAAALEALAHWRRAAHQALARVRAVPRDAPGRKVAERWLKSLIVGLDLQRQALSLIDPTKAAQAAGLAGTQIAESHRLELRLDRVLP